MATRWVIGLAAGPCLTGIDAALVEVEGLGLHLRVRVLHWLTQPHSREFRDLLVAVTTPGRSEGPQLALAHRALGECMAAAARLLADRASVTLHQVLCIGCHSLTAILEAESRHPTLLAIGASAVVAERTGLTTISDFRWRDLALGGQGGPIGALAYGLLFGIRDESRLLVNLGGIAEATYLPRERGPRASLAWDAAPGTVLLDALIQEISGGKERVDAGGRLAVQGRLIPELLHAWSLHPFLLRKAPKSLHRASFGEDLARQAVQLAMRKGWNPHDLLCTANHLVARAIADSARQRLQRRDTIERVILTGRGARNGLLWRLLEEQFAGAPLETSDAFGMPVEACNAINAGVLACLTLDGEPGNLPAATGAAGSRLLGNLTPGSPSNWSHCLDWMTGNVYSVVGEAEE